MKCVAPSGEGMKAHVVREDEFLKELIAEYYHLYGVQDAMRRRMRNMFPQAIDVDQRRKIYDAVYRIDVEKIRIANEGLHEYKLYEQIICGLTYKQGRQNSTRGKEKN